MIWKMGLMKCVGMAMKQKWANENPALDLEMPKIVARQIAPLEPEEVAKIEVEAAKNPRYYAMVLLLRHSGLRIVTRR